jgi:hypothetical protein
LSAVTRPGRGRHRDRKPPAAGSVEAKMGEQGAERTGPGAREAAARSGSGISQSARPSTRPARRGRKGLRHARASREGWAGIEEGPSGRAGQPGASERRGEANPASTGSPAPEQRRLVVRARRRCGRPARARRGGRARVGRCDLPRMREASSSSDERHSLSADPGACVVLSPVSVSPSARVLRLAEQEGGGGGPHEGEPRRRAAQPRPTKPSDATRRIRCKPSAVDRNLSFCPRAGDAPPPARPRGRTEGVGWPALLPSFSSVKHLPQPSAPPLVPSLVSFEKTPFVGLNLSVSKSPRHRRKLPHNTKPFLPSELTGLGRDQRTQKNRQSRPFSGSCQRASQHGLQATRQQRHDQRPALPGRRMAWLRRLGRGAASGGGGRHVAGRAAGGRQTTTPGQASSLVCPPSPDPPRIAVVPLVGAACRACPGLSVRWPRLRSSTLAPDSTRPSLPAG